MLIQIGSTLYVTERFDYGDSKDVNSVVSTSDKTQSFLPTVRREKTESASDLPDVFPTYAADDEFGLKFTRSSSPLFENPSPPTSFNADDFLIMKASSECECTSITLFYDKIMPTCKATHCYC